MDHLRALIKSKGTDLPIGRRKKQVLQDIWDEVKDKDDWERDVFFDNTDKVELDQLEELLALKWRLSSLFGPCLLSDKEDYVLML